jgi:anti-sigma factor RsiW
MTCDEAKVLLHALIDGELDAGHAREIEAHTAGCAHCAARLVAYRELRQGLKGHKLRYAAPVALRNRIDRAVPAPRVGTSRRSLLKGFALGSVMSAAAAVGVAVMIVGEDRSGRILNEAVSAHLRSLQGEHLVDVLSSDRHTVKPWFNGRIDLAPPVIDLTAQGFTLIGGRLDYIDGRPVAAIVYRRRVHVINLFVSEASGAESALTRSATVQGFNTLRWTDHGLRFIAISDINADELREFDEKFRAALQKAT